jgi:indolepyruvate decarboxylase
VAAAYAERSPVVVVSGGPGKNEARSGLLLHHQAKTLDSQFQIFRESTCDQARLDDASRAPDDIARVLSSCRRRAQPVYLELPRDMVTAPCSRGLRPADRTRRPKRRGGLGRLSRALGADGRHEVRRYGLRKVAELARLGIPAVTGSWDGAPGGAPAPPGVHGVAGDPWLTGWEGGRALSSADRLGHHSPPRSARSTARHHPGRAGALGYHVYPDVRWHAGGRLLSRSTPGDSDHALPAYRGPGLDRPSRPTSRRRERPLARHGAASERHGRLLLHRHGPSTSLGPELRQHGSAPAGFGLRPLPAAGILWATARSR